MSHELPPEGAQQLSAPHAGAAFGIEIVSAASVPAQAWRNGGGQTRELLVWPAHGDWQLRISRADIERDGPFSAFPQVERWFAVLKGEGVVLGFDGGEHKVRRTDDALHFDGAAAPACRLLDGPTQDLNLMVRDGAGVMQGWRAGQPWHDAFAMRGLYTTVAGRWRSGAASIDLAADSLLWSAALPSGPWSFDALHPDTAGNAWWLGFTPRS